MTPTVVGLFSVERLSLQSWQVTNLHFGFRYVTYGTWEEVHDQLLVQTEAWERKLRPKKHGEAWRGKAAVESSSARRKRSQAV